MANFLAGNPPLKIMSLTEAAKERVRSLMAQAPTPVAALRLGVKNAGCAGMSYTMEFTQTIGKHDTVVDDDGVRLVIDAKAILFLLGTEMDYQVSALSSGFVFNNPNQTSACGCGESVALTAVDPSKLTQLHQHS